MREPEPTMPKPENPHAKIYRGFREQTADHRLAVLHDDGLYRHLRMQAPGTRMWSWDITTWPGHLATSGDVGAGFTFAREADMIEFFSLAGKSDGYFSDGAPSIDFRYWAEKLVGDTGRHVKVHSDEAFVREVHEHLEEHEQFGTDAEALRARQIRLLERIREMRGRRGLDELPSVQDRLADHWAGRISHDELFSYEDLSQAEMDQLAKEFDVDQDGKRCEHDLFALEYSDLPEQDPAKRRKEILDDARLHAESTHEAYTWLSDNEDLLDTSDTWEWDFREYNSQFLFACYCIDLAVRLYRDQRAEAPDAPDQNKD